MPFDWQFKWFPYIQIKSNNMIWYMYVIIIYTYKYIYIHIIVYGVFLKWGYPQIIHFNRIFPYKPSSYWVPHGETPRDAAVADALMCNFHGVDRPAQPGIPNTRLEERPMTSQDSVFHNVYIYDGIIHIYVYIHIPLHTHTHIYIYIIYK